MIRRLSLALSSLATATLLPLAACSDDTAPDDRPPPDDSHDARFASASLEHKQRALGAALGADAATGLGIASLLAFVPSEVTCPRVTRAGDTLTATSDCTDDQGARWSGRVIAKNLPSIAGDHDPDRPIEVTFDAYANDGPGIDDVALDGTVVLRPDGSQTVALTARLDGIEATTQATWRRFNERTSADAGSTVEVADLGAARIGGTWRLEEGWIGGSIELRGADVLWANFDRMTGGCVPLTVNGTPAGELCDAVEPP